MKGYQVKIFFVSFVMFIFYFLVVTSIIYLTKEDNYTNSQNIVQRINNDLYLIEVEKKKFIVNKNGGILELDMNEAY